MRDASRDLHFSAQPRRELLARRCARHDLECDDLVSDAVSRTKHDTKRARAYLLEQFVALADYRSGFPAGLCLQVCGWAALVVFASRLERDTVSAVPPRVHPGHRRSVYHARF